MHALYGNEHHHQMQPYTPTIHALKTWITFYGMVANGTKCFEVRRNDRRFQEGDIVQLKEWNPSKEEYTGRECFRTIRYILAGGQFGVENDHVVLGFDPPAPANTQHYHALMAFVAWVAQKEGLNTTFVRSGCDMITDYCNERGIPTS